MLVGYIQIEYIRMTRVRPSGRSFLHNILLIRSGGLSRARLDRAIDSRQIDPYRNWRVLRILSPEYRKLNGEISRAAARRGPAGYEYVYVLIYIYIYFFIISLNPRECLLSLMASSSRMAGDFRTRFRFR